MNWIFGDNINTDLITPGRYNTTTDPDALAKIAFIEYRPEFAKKIKPGDFVVGGNNFGCGSSRETAATALRACGVKAIIANSFARIFYRNCMNQGILVIVADTSDIAEEDELELDFKNQFIINKTKNKKVKGEMPKIMMRLYEEGGLVPYVQKYGIQAVRELFE